MHEHTGVEPSGSGPNVISTAPSCHLDRRERSPASRFLASLEMTGAPSCHPERPSSLSSQTPLLCHPKRLSLVIPNASPLSSRTPLLCHPERSEGSRRLWEVEISRFARNDRAECHLDRPLLSSRPPPPVISTAGRDLHRRDFSLRSKREVASLEMTGAPCARPKSLKPPLRVYAHTGVEPSGSGGENLNHGGYGRHGENGEKKRFFFSTSSIPFHGFPRFKQAARRITESWRHENRGGCS